MIRGSVEKLILSLFLLSSCQNATVIISGRASNISGGAVTVQTFGSDGAIGEVITNTTSDAKGFYSMEIPSDNGTGLYLSVTGGTYKDRATGRELTNTELNALVTRKFKRKIHASITPASHLAAARARQLIRKKGKGTNAETVIIASNIQISRALGITWFFPSSGFSKSDSSSPPEIVEIVPVDSSETITLDADAPELKVELFSALVDQIAENLTATSPGADGFVTPNEVSDALATDIATDGILNGKNEDVLVPVGDNTVGGLPISAAEWAGVSDNFIDSTDNVGFSTDVDATITVDPPLEIPATTDNPTLVPVDSLNGHSSVYCDCEVPSLDFCIDYTGSFFSTSCEDQRAICLELASDAKFTLGEACPVAITETVGGTCSAADELETFAYYYTSDTEILNSESQLCVDSGQTWAP